MRRRCIIIAGFGIVAVAMAAIIFVWMIPRSNFLSSMSEHFTPGLVPSSSYVNNLKSDDPNLVRESLGFLRRRKDPAGVSNALPLLQSQDEYIWLNASLYTGTCGRQEAVPYLIKALRHTAFRADPDTVATLVTLTSQNFGTDFSKWQAWWTSQNPNQSFDWTSHLGFAPRVPVTQQN